MGDTFKVNVPALKQASTSVTNESTELSSSHRQSMANLSDAEQGWVGSSADALVTMSTKWQKIADKHVSAMAKHATHMSTAADLFAYQEEQSAAKLRAVGEQADAVNPRDM